MKLFILSFRMVWGLAVLVGVMTYPAVSSFAAEEASDTTAAVQADLSHFCTVWMGSGKLFGAVREVSMVVEITPRQEREVGIVLECLSPLDFKASGTGVVTPNCISWVLLKDSEGEEFFDFSRYMATYTEGQGLTGKCFSSEDLSEAGSFTLQKVDPQPVQEFNGRIQSTLQRVQAAARKADFLPPPWKVVLVSTQMWLEKTLNVQCKFIDERLYPDLEYATRLAESLEKGENFFQKHTGADFPLWFRNHSGKPYDIQHYYVSFPSDFPDQDQYPLLINLHGGGGSNKNIRFDLDSKRHDNPLIVVKPIVRSIWNPQSLNLFLEEIKRLFPIDEERVYLRGGSMGGIGTCVWAMTHPEHFAAIAPIAGYDDIPRVQRLKNIPVWIYQGEKDDRIPMTKAEVMISALEELGGTVKYTFFPEGKHDIFTIVDYKEMEDWFLAQRRSPEPIPPDPLQELAIGKEGIGPPKKVELPTQRFVALQSEWERMSLHPKPLYEVYKKAGVRPRGIVEIQVDTTSPDSTVHLLLPVPHDLEINDTAEEISVLDTPASPAYVFGVYGDFSTREEDRIIRTFIEQLKEKGEKPSGEYRLQFMSFNYETGDPIYRVLVPLEQ